MYSLRLKIIYALLGFGVFGFVLGGCARTVTPEVDFGTTAVVEVHLRGNVDVTQNKYYMVISTQESYQLPFYPYEFIEPEVAPTDPTVNYYLYYSTWYSYVVLDSSSNYFRVPGPFVSTQEVYTHYQIGSLTSPTSILRFNLNLNEVFPNGIPTRFYFELVTVGSTRMLRDYLGYPNKSILTYKDTELSETDAENSDIDASLDILSWKVLIQ
jgi:hypothetical protein